MSMLTSPAKVQESHALCNPRSPKVSPKKLGRSGITLTFFPLTKTCLRSLRRHQLFYRTSFSFRVTGCIINGEGQFLPLSNIDLLLFCSSQDEFSLYLPSPLLLPIAFVEWPATQGGSEGPFGRTKMATIQ